MPRRRSKPRGRISRLSSLLGSATQQTPQDAGAAGALVQAWQRDALNFYSCLEVCHDSAQFYARSLSQVRLFVQRTNEQGETEEIPTGDPASEALDRIMDPGGSGKEQLLASYGRLQFLTGDGYLVCLNEGTDEEEWRYLSVLELQPGQAGWIWKQAPSLSSVNLKVKQGANAPEGGQGKGDVEGGEASVWRLWNPHPAWSKLADSPIMGVLHLFRLLQASDKALEAFSKSRAANAGLLVVNGDIDFSSADAQAADDDPEGSAFETRLYQTFRNAISNPGSAEAVAPIVVTIDGEMMGQAFEKIELRPSMEKYAEPELQEWLIDRIAIGLDMPPEELKGKGDVNHWGSWQIDATSYRIHIRPVIERFCNDVTAAYLRPAWKQDRVSGWEELSLGYDAAELVVHPDRAKDVKEGYRDGVVSRASYLDAIGLNETDGMPEEEHEEWLAIQLRDKSIAGIEGEAPPGLEDGITEDASNESGNTVEEAVPEKNGNGKVTLASMILGAAEVALERSREVAGARLRTRVRNAKCVECEGLIASSLPSEYAASLGRERVTELDERQPRALVAEGSESFVRSCERMGVSATAARKLGEIVELRAAEQLFESRPAGMPDGFLAYVEKVLAA